MKTFTKTLLALTAGTLLTAGANAAVYQTANNTNTNYGYTGQPYVGVKIGQFNLDDADNATAYGIDAGYQFNNNWGIEAEYLGSDDADVDNVYKGSYDVKTYGLYGTYNYQFPSTAVYAKAKLGIAKTDATIDGRNSLEQKVSVDGDSTGLAGGIGLGYNVSPNVALEADYNYLPQAEFDNGLGDRDASLWTVGAKVKF